MKKQTLTISSIHQDSARGQFARVFLVHYAIKGSTQTAFYFGTSPVDFVGKRSLKLLQQQQKLLLMLFACHTLKKYNYGSAN